MDHFLDIALGPASRRHQQRRGSRDAYQQLLDTPPPAGLGPDEIEFLAERDSCYLASVGQSGWPYVQHRGGPVGFIRVLDPTLIAWAERSGNRQFVTAGNLDDDDRISLIAVDYPNRRRLKLFGHARFDPAPSAADLRAVGAEGRVEGLVVVEVSAFDWNCPKYITPRFTAEQVDAAAEPLRRRIAELEQQLATATRPGTPA